MSDNLRGILLMCLAMLAFVVNDSFMKALTQDLPLFQVITLRGLGASAALMALGYWREGNLRLWPTGDDRGTLALRTIAEVLATITFLTALVHMPLATLSAIMQALPLAVTLTAALLYRQAIPGKVWAAIGAGFIGVLLIIKPGFAGFDRWSVVGLMSVACVVLRDLSTRHVSEAMPSTTVAIWASLGVTLLGLFGGVIEGWHAASMLHLLLILGTTLALVIGYVSVVMVMRVGEVAIVAPFRYTALLWALLFGWVFFGSLPDIYALIGAAIVVVSGIVTLRQAQKNKT